MDYVIDLMPYLIGTYEFLKPTLTLVLPMVIIWAATKLAQKFHIESEVLRNDRLQEVLSRGIAFGLSRLEATLKDRKLEVNTKSQVISLAAGYVASSLPDTLKKFGVTPERLAELVEAKLGELQAKAVIK